MTSKNRVITAMSVLELCQSSAPLYNIDSNAVDDEQIEENITSSESKTKKKSLCLYYFNDRWRCA